LPVYTFENHRPSIGATTYVSPTAQIIGKVTIGERCYVGHGAVLRGDFGAIEIGDETAIEEGVIVHSRPDECTRIGARVTVGHGAMVHNASVADGAVIGMRAVISDYAEVGAGAIVGEMALVKNHQKVPPGKVAVGVPVRVVGDIDERHHMMTHTAKELYVELARRYAEGAMVEITPPSPGVGSKRDE
jgi:carbonic anhydrase/acetyltransferase-like protein (isoleucine patch superfamily)